mgnify:CR=1 FL=1|nr:MAG TPA: hypothetical protein [Caudoviricetes sp.]
MPTITLSVKKSEVWDEVAKISGYTGDKLTDADENTYERILMTDEDQESLQRFWDEAAAVANDQLKEMLETASSASDDYNVVLLVPRNYDTVLNESVEVALKGYFISAIVGRWFRLADKDEAEGYMTEAGSMMKDVLRKLYSRKRPQRAKAEAESARLKAAAATFPAGATAYAGPSTNPAIWGGTPQNVYNVGSCYNRYGQDSEQEPKWSNTLVFLRDELLLDIQNYTFVTADIMPADDDHLKHQVFDVAQSGNDELATRILNLAHAECVESLYPFTKTPCIQDEKLDDKLVVPERYEIELALPKQFSRTTVLLLKELIHDYFVCRVLVEWLGITYPAGQSLWKERLELLMARMKRALLGRRKPLRRSQSMF